MFDSARSHRARARATTVGAAAAALAAAVLAPAAAAQAEAAPAHAPSPLHAVGAVHRISGPTTFTFTFLVGGGGHTAAGKPSTVQPRTLSCTVTANPPFEYYGGTYGGGEEGLANTSCAPSVYSLETEVALFLNGSEVSYNNLTNYATVSTSADTVYPLAAGSYVTEMDAIVVPTYGAAPEYSGIYATSAVNLP